MSNKSATSISQSQLARCLQILASAFVVGLSIPIGWFGILRLSALWPINTPSWRFIANWTLICLVSYLVAGLLVIAIRTARTFSLNWLVLSISGSFLLAIIYTFRPLSLSQLGVTDLLLVHFRDALGTTLWLSVFTTPISALAYYSISFFRWRSSNNSFDASAGTSTQPLPI